MNRRYGDGTWEKMIIASRQTCKFSQFEYDILIGRYTKEVARLKLEKGIA